MPYGKMTKNMNDNQKRFFDGLELGFSPDGRNMCLAGIDNRSLGLVDCQLARDLVELAGLNDDRQDSALTIILPLIAAKNQGSLCLDLSDLPAAAAKLAGTDSDRLTERALSMFRQGRLDSLIGHGTAADAAAFRPLLIEDGRLYFQKCHRHERSLRDRLRRLCESPPCPFDATALANAVRQSAEFTEYNLNNEQMMAVYLACRQRFSVISGGPGTGKTTLAAALLRTLSRLEPGFNPLRVALVAPTGRAGRRLGESLRNSLEAAGDRESSEIISGLMALDGRTIHQLLKYNPSRHAFVHDENYKLDANLIICDEVSMVDVILMDRLLAALNDDCRIVFLGDKDQLPSVDAGAVLGDLVPRNREPSFSAAMAAEIKALIPSMPKLPPPGTGKLIDRIVILTACHRAGGEVLRAAGALNNGDITVADKIPVINLQSETGGGFEWPQSASACRRIEPGRGGGRYRRLRGLLRFWSRRFLGSIGNDGESYQSLAAKRIEIDFERDSNDGVLPPDQAARFTSLFGKLFDGQILSIVREGNHGCVGINFFLSEYWRPLLDPDANAKSPVFTGMPVMVTRNNHRLKLFNGDIGIIVRDTASRHQAVFPRGGDNFLILPTERLPEHEPAFAITVHKSQGSEYGNVLIIMPDNDEHRLLTREIVYTGITRGKGDAFIFGTADSLRQAAAKRIDRGSGINLWA